MYDATAISSSHCNSAGGAFAAGVQTKEKSCMWKSTPGSDTKPMSTTNAAPAMPTPARPSLDPVRTKEFQSEMAHIGKSVIIRGELSGSEDLYLDGEVEGNISLMEHNLIVGPNGR